MTASSFCGSCGCPVEPVPQPAVHGFVHACKHTHKHLIPFSIDQKRREQMPRSMDGVVA